MLGVNKVLNFNVNNSHEGIMLACLIYFSRESVERLLFFLTPSHYVITSRII